MNIVQDRITRARVITPTSTFVKYDWAIGDSTSVVKRDGTVVAELTDATANWDGPRIRVEGRTPGGEHAVWLVDNLGCGCGTSPHVLPTPEGEVPR